MNSGVVARGITALCLAAGLGAFGCRSQPAAPPPPTPPPAPTLPHVQVETLVSRIGVKPGPLAYPNIGPDAALMGTGGAVSVRRVGEDRFVDSTPKMPLYAGDTIWTGPHTEATVALADDTLVQLAEETVVTIGNRSVSADPASSVAVLYGVARVSVSPRARGEGAFLTSAGGSGLVGAKGTAFAVGVVAGGSVRVGVEHGEVEVAGAQGLDKPITLGTGQATTIDGAGVVGAPSDFKRDDWGEWRFATEQRSELAAIARFHSDRLLGEEARLDANYLVLQTLATNASTLTWQAEANTTPKAAAEYKATAVERAAAIESTYRMASEISRLTHAALSDAFVLSELRARHSDLAPTISEFSQEMAAALLYDKKLQLVSEIYLGPLRSAYYAHTARGRAQASALDMPTPAFAQVKLVAPPAAEMAKRLPPGLYVAPRLESTTRPHPLWQRAPKVGWNERLTLQPVPPRQGSWYVAPLRVEAHVLAGVPTPPQAASVFPVTPSLEASKSDLSFLVPPLPPVGTNAPAP